MGFDYGKYFGEIKLTHDLTTRAAERTWRLAAPEATPARKPIVLYLGCNVLRTSCTTSRATRRRAMAWPSARSSSSSATSPTRS